MHYFAVLLIIASLTTKLSASEIDTNELIAQAVQAYQSALDAGDRNLRVQLFGRAEALFARVIQQKMSDHGPRGQNAELYVNLGNAALGAERMGPAILAYRRALVVDPTHRRAEQNLNHVRTLLPDWVPKPEETVPLGSFFDWTRGLRRGDWFGLASIAFLLTAILTAIYLRTGKTTARNLVILFGILWIGTLARAVADNSMDAARVAVVVVPEVTARAADSFNAPVRFPEPLPGGTELQIVDERDEWFKVRLFDSREAWLPTSAIEMETPSTKIN